MYIWSKLPTGLISGFLISTAHAPEQSEEQRDVAASAMSRAARPNFVVLFGPVSPKFARDLPRYLIADEVGAVKPSAEDLRVQKKALALIARAIEFIDREGPFVDFGSATEHREG